MKRGTFFCSCVIFLNLPVMSQQASDQCIVSTLMDRLYSGSFPLLSQVPSAQSTYRFPAFDKNVHRHSGYGGVTTYASSNVEHVFVGLNFASKNHQGGLYFADPILAMSSNHDDTSSTLAFNLASWTTIRTPVEHTGISLTGQFRKREFSSIVPYRYLSLIDSMSVKVQGTAVIPLGAAREKGIRIVARIGSNEKMIRDDRMSSDGTSYRGSDSSTGSELYFSAGFIKRKQSTAYTAGVFIMRMHDYNTGWDVWNTVTQYRLKDEFSLGFGLDCSLEKRWAPAEKFVILYGPELNIAVKALNSSTIPQMDDYYDVYKKHGYADINGAFPVALHLKVTESFLLLSSLKTTCNYYLRNDEKIDLSSKHFSIHYSLTPLGVWYKPGRCEFIAITTLNQLYALELRFAL